MTPKEARAWADQQELRLEYQVALGELARARAPFLRLDIDQGTADYIEASAALRHGRFKSLLHRSLRPLFSDFDINGLLGTYPMHVLSAAQWGQLLEQEALTTAPPTFDASSSTLLDIGSGRGDVTAQLATHFKRVVCTETSAKMIRRLRRLGFEAIEGDVADEALKLPEDSFDAISLLNVLDRCDRPLSLLGRARSLMKENGLLIIALVLPYRPFVYEGAATRPPRERLPIHQLSFEGASCDFVELALRGLGLEIISLSRTPYLSGGDPGHALYELDNLVVVARAQGSAPLLLQSTP